MMIDLPILTVLEQIRQTQPATRRSLSEQTGLSVARIHTLVSWLIDRHLVVEEPLQGGTPGRPAVALHVNPNAGRVCGLDIGGQHSRAVLSDLAGNVLAATVWPSEATPDRRVILDNLAHLIQTVCQEGGIEPENLGGIGVGVRGIVDTRTGVVLGWPNTPAWSVAWAGLDVPAEFGRRLGHDLIVVDDSVRAMGLTALRYGPARGCRNFLYVFLGSGVGSGIFVDGRPYRGSRGIAGEIGHVTIDDEGPWCSCGSRGCLETFASASGVLRRLQERLADVRSASILREPYERGQLGLSDLVTAAQAGDKLAFQVLDETGAYVGKVLATALNLLGPELIVLGGPLTQDSGVILQAVQRQVRLHALQHLSSEVRVVYDDQGDLAGARGAALLALDALFCSPQHVARLLDHSPEPVLGT